MIVLRSTSAALAALSIALAAPAVAQTVSGGSAGGVEGPGVSASTYGAGETDGQSVGVQGGGAATAIDGTASTDSAAKVNERRAMQRSVAKARDDDERARSRTHTIVRNGETVRSRTTSFYKQKGEKPVHESVYSVTTPEGQTVTRR
jgi:hypothetical protein